MVVAVPLGVAEDRVRAVLVERTAEGSLSRGSAAAYGRRLDAFVGYCRAIGVSSTAQFDARLLSRWTDAPISAVSPGSRGRAGGQAANATRRARQGLLRLALRIWAQEGWVDAGLVPTQVIDRTPSQAPSPLTPAEVWRLRMAGQQSPADTLLPTLVTLGLAGVNHTEIARLTLDGYDGQTGMLTVVGRGRATRVIALDAAARTSIDAHVRALGRAKRLKDLTADSGRCPLALPTAPRTHRREVTATAVGQHLYRALDIAGVTRAGVTPGSLQEYAANACYARTNRVEDVAALLGFVSLDAAKRLVDASWQTTYAATIREQQG